MSKMLTEKRLLSDIDIQSVLCDIDTYRYKHPHIEYRYVSRMGNILYIFIFGFDELYKNTYISLLKEAFAKKNVDINIIDKINTNKPILGKIFKMELKEKKLRVKIGWPEWATNLDKYVIDYSLTQDQVDRIKKIINEE